MVITKKRIINPKIYLKGFNIGDEIRIGIRVEDDLLDIINKIGFTENLNIGETILPDAKLSRIAFENAEGKCIVRKDQPMETAERYWEWSWEDWGGNYHSDWTYVEYKRYVREYLPPVALELSIAKDKEDKKWIVTKIIKINESNYDEIKLAMNLFLSLFGRFEVVDSFIKPPINLIRRCNWEILRPGEMDKNEMKEVVDRIIKHNVPKGKQNMYKRNFNLLLNSGPNIVSIGTEGFGGYIAFDYPKKKIAVLESLMPNNATYILNEDWEDVSKYTKAQVLNNNLHKDRIYHYSNWEERVREYVD